MKKLLIGFVLFSVVGPNILCAGGGDAAIGGFAGSMFGSMVGTAMTRDSSRSSNKHVDQEIQKEKVSQLQREMDKKELETKLEQQRLVEQQRLMTMQQERERSNSFMYLLFGIIFIMFLAVLGLGVLLIHMRKKN
jgi:hypothetical protein